MFRSDLGLTWDPFYKVEVVGCYVMGRASLVSVIGWERTAHHLYLIKGGVPQHQIQPIHSLSVTIRAILLLYIWCFEKIIIGTTVMQIEFSLCSDKWALFNQEQWKVAMFALGD